MKTCLAFSASLPLTHAEKLKQERGTLLM